MNLLKKFFMAKHYIDEVRVEINKFCMPNWVQFNLVFNDVTSRLAHWVKLLSPRLKIFVNFI